MSIESALNDMITVFASLLDPEPSRIECRLRQQTIDRARAALAADRNLKPAPRSAPRCDIYLQFDEGIKHPTCGTYHTPEQPCPIAPRSAEHTAEPSAQDKMRDPNYYPPSAGDSPFARWFVDYRQRAGLDPAQATSAYYTGVSAWRSALATAPITRIEAEPVGYVSPMTVKQLGLMRQYGRIADSAVIFCETSEQHSIPVYMAPPDRTPDARSTMTAQGAAPVADEDFYRVPKSLWIDMCGMNHTAEQDWKREGCWSAWDQSVADRRVAFNIADMERIRAAAIASPEARVAQTDARSTSDAAVVLPSLVCGTCNGAGVFGSPGTPCRACCTNLADTTSDPAELAQIIAVRREVFNSLTVTEFNSLVARAKIAEYSKSDAAVVVTDAMVNRFLTWPLPDNFMSDGCVLIPQYPHPRSGTNIMDHAQARQMLEHVLADRATRSTDSSAEAAGMERAAKWVDKRRDDYDAEHGSTDPETGTRWWPGDGEDYMFELDEIATGILAEAAKLTTASHTVERALLQEIYDANVATHDENDRGAGLRFAVAMRAIDDYLTTAPHTADETRVDGGA